MPPIDPQLLRVFQAVFAERHVSRAADRLGLTQPAASASLRRLREVFGDPLFLRAAHGVTTTERANALAPRVDAALAMLDALAAEARPFDPTRDDREFRVGAPDYLDAGFLPRLVATVRTEAPAARLRVRALDPDMDCAALLERGELDLVIGNWPNPPEQLRTAPLFDDRVVCVMAASHPLARGGLDRDAWLAAAHVAPDRWASHARSAIDGHLEDLGLKRDIRVVLPYFNLVPAVLARTDLLFTTGQRFARDCAAREALVVVPAPIDFPPMRFRMLWHERTHADDAQAWLRERVARCVRGTTGGKDPPARPGA